MYLFLYFLKFILSIFFEDHIGNKCAIVCFNVSILGKYYMYMYYNVLPNKLTLTLTTAHVLLSISVEEEKDVAVATGRCSQHKWIRLR